jgi:hypothetical protein
MSDEWIKTLADRRRVKFTNQELDEKAFLTDQIEGNKVVYPIVLNGAENPLSREEVETHFEGELSKLSPETDLSLRASRQRLRRDLYDSPTLPLEPFPPPRATLLCLLTPAAGHDAARYGIVPC